jgi:hypothetical protein
MSPRPVLISCTARTPEEVRSEVLLAIARRRSPEGSTFLVLEDLQLVKGSVTRCLAELVRVAAEAGAHLVVADPSGLAEAFLEGIGGAEPFVAVRGQRRSG